MASSIAGGGRKQDLRCKPTSIESHVITSNWKLHNTADQQSFEIILGIWKKLLSGSKGVLCKCCNSEIAGEKRTGR